MFTLTLGGFAARARGDAEGRHELLAQARAALGGDKQAGEGAGALRDRHLSARDGRPADERRDHDRSAAARQDAAHREHEPDGRRDDRGAAGHQRRQVLRNSRTIGGGPGHDDPHRAAARRRRRRSAGAAQPARRLRALRARVPADVAARRCRSSITYGGEAEADDGKADVVDAKGPGSFAARLFLDKKTPSAADAVVSRRGAADGRADAARRRSAARPNRDARGNAAPGHGPGELPPPQIVDIQMFLDDYKSVDGVMLPHHISRSIDGKPTEEMDVQDDQAEPDVQARHVLGEVGRAQRSALSW